jgi:protein-S-isoprenylcysteine O-methyltransferase Ste14
MHYRIPRWIALIWWSAEFGAVHVGVPVFLSRLARRHGWYRGQPAAANLAGLIPLTAGAGLVAWTLAMHYAAAPKGWAIKPRLAPEYLLTQGPYRVTRNPMYAGGLAIWGGWAALFGSVPLAVGLAVLAAVMRRGVRWEERSLRTHFGDEWHAYAATTPRWLRAPRRTGQSTRRT